MEKRKTCPDCGVKIGEIHRPNCDVERCPYCGGQLLSCDCTSSEKGRKWIEKNRMPWTGIWPGVAECRKFGWYAKMVPGKGWVSCKPDEFGAHEDLNRLCIEAYWDREKKRFLKCCPHLNKPEDCIRCDKRTNIVLQCKKCTKRGGGQTWHLVQGKTATCRRCGTERPYKCEKKDIAISSR